MEPFLEVVFTIRHCGYFYFIQPQQLVLHNKKRFSKDLLKITKLSLSYQSRERWILEDLDLDIKAGERLALVGSSGSGKSSLVKVLTGLLPPGSLCLGSVRFLNQELIDQNKNLFKSLRGNQIGLVFQDPASRLNPLMTVRDHLFDTLIAHNPEISLVLRDKRSKDLLYKVGIDLDYFEAYPHQLSGGMRQRLSIALAISQNPSLLIADEPTSSLDVMVANQIMIELNNLCKNLNIALLLITHDIALASRWCERMAILDYGKIVELGPTLQLLKSPQSSMGKRLVKAVVEKENLKVFDTKQSHQILRVERLQCWHSLAKLPWQKKWIRAVNDISFELNAGETLGIVGVSGCGKSTLCRALMGLLPIKRGNVYLKGKNIQLLRGSRLRKARKSIQMVFQDPFASLPPQMNLRDAICDPLLIHGILSKNQARQKARDLLIQVGLTPPENFEHLFPHQISGGQQQRVVIARALALSPEVLICDESVSMLDVEIQAEVLNLIKLIQKQFGLGVIFITHDLLLAKGFCDRIIVLDNGKILKEDNANNIFINPKELLIKEMIDACPSIIKSIT